MKVNANTLTKGNVVEIEGKLMQVLSTFISKPGKGGAFIQLELRDIRNGNKDNMRFRTQETIEKVVNKEVSDFMKVPMSTATGIVDKLVSKGYLMRFYSEEDRRIVRIGLSKFGQELYDLLEKLMHYFGQHILEGFTSEERDQFIFLMEKATRNLDFKLKTGELA